MPKEAITVRNKERYKKATNKMRKKIRKELKAKLCTEEGVEAMFALQSRPKNESITRYVRRCQRCSRSRGVYRKFGLCRLCLIKYAGLGMIAGLTISSW